MIGIMGFCVFLLIWAFAYEIPNWIKEIDNRNCERLLDPNLPDKNPFYNQYTPEEAVAKCNEFKIADKRNLESIPIIMIIMTVLIVPTSVFFLFNPKDDSNKQNSSVNNEATD